MTTLLPCVLAALVAAAGPNPEVACRLGPPLPPDRNPPFTVSIYDGSMKLVQRGQIPAGGVYADVLDPAIGKALVKVTDGANKLVGLAGISFDGDSHRWRRSLPKLMTGAAPEGVDASVVLVGAIPFQVQTPDGSALRQPAAIDVYHAKDDGTGLDYGSKAVSGRTGPSGEPYVEALDVDSLEPTALLRIVVARQADGNGLVLGSSVIRFNLEQGRWEKVRFDSDRHRWEKDDLEIPFQAVRPDISIKIPARLPLQVGAVDQSGWLAAYADVAIYTLAGQCIRRGKTEISTYYCPEASEPLDPAYQRLLVAVRKSWGDGSPWGTMLLTFDHNNWRPHVIYPHDGKAQIEFDDAHDRFFPIRNGSHWSAPLVLAAVTMPPIPVVCTAAGPCDLACVPLAPPAPLCAPMQEIPLPYGVASGLAPFGARLPRALPPTSDCPPSAAGLIAQRDEAITHAGRSATPELPWADFGKCWENGPIGMYWQTPVWP